MQKSLRCFMVLMMSFAASAEHHSAEIHAAKVAFEEAYVINAVETYFNFYSDDATVYFGGDTKGDMAAYREMWSALIAAGGGVKFDEL